MVEEKVKFKIIEGQVITDTVEFKKIQELLKDNLATDTNLNTRGAS